MFILDDIAVLFPETVPIITPFKILSTLAQLGSSLLGSVYFTSQSGLAEN